MAQDVADRLERGPGAQETDGAAVAERVGTVLALRLDARTLQTARHHLVQAVAAQGAVPGRLRPHKQLPQRRRRPCPTGGRPGWFGPHAAAGAGPIPVPACCVGCAAAHAASRSLPDAAAPARWRAGHRWRAAPAWRSRVAQRRFCPASPPRAPPRSPPPRARRVAARARRRECSTPRRQGHGSRSAARAGNAGTSATDTRAASASIASGRARGTGGTHRRR